jgi:hypothetical protein
MLLRPRFDVETTFRDIEEKKANYFPGVPTMWIALTSSPDLEKRDLSSLSMCASGGAPLPVEVFERFKKITGISLRGGWGMTETAPAGTNLPYDGDAPAGTIGLPLPGIYMDVVALDEPTRLLPFGETGEMRIKGPNVFAGYWNKPEETKAAFVEDGHFLTGDIGTMDVNGWLFLVDRKKDMIISGGFNVYPSVIEQALFEHPDIEGVIVIGVPDDYRGEAAKAFIKMRKDAPPLTARRGARLSRRQSRQARNARRHRNSRRASHDIGRQAFQEGAGRGRAPEIPSHETTERVRSERTRANSEEINMREAVIVSTARTPIGKAYRGAFNNTEGATLYGHAIEHAVKRAGIDGAEVEDVVMVPHSSRAQPAATSRARRCCVRGCRSPSPAPRSTGNARPACRRSRWPRVRSFTTAWKSRSAAAVNRSAWCRTST